MLALPMAMVESRESGREQNTLVNWLRTGICWDAAQRRRIDDVLKAYHVGHARQGHTIFWQIDNNGIVHTGKMMLYRPDGHRDREARYGFDWIHASLARGIPKRDEHGKILRDEEGNVIYDNTVFKHIYDDVDRMRLLSGSDREVLRKAYLSIAKGNLSDRQVKQLSQVLDKLERETDYIMPK